VEFKLSETSCFGPSEPAPLPPPTSSVSAAAATNTSSQPEIMMALQRKLSGDEQFQKLSRVEDEGVDSRV